MLYLSDMLSTKAKNLSRNLLEINGWQDQFIITKKAADTYSAVVADYSLHGLSHSAHNPDLIKRIVILIIVSYHLVNHLDIKPGEFKKIGFTGYKQNGILYPGKIPRTFEKVLGTEYQFPKSNFNIRNELNIAAEKVLYAQKEKLGDIIGARFQLCIASEEAGELGKEISKYYRASLTGDISKLAVIRETIAEELFDTLYTIRYVMELAGIYIHDLNNFARIYIPHLYSKHVFDKLKDSLER